MVDLKAFITFPAPGPWENGSCIIYAETRNQARMAGLVALPWFGDLYLDMRARRLPEYDQFVDPDVTGPYAVETNADLPEDAPLFYNDEEY